MSNQPTTDRPILLDRTTATRVLFDLELFRLTCHELQARNPLHAVGECQYIIGKVTGLEARGQWLGHPEAGPLHAILNTLETYRDQLPMTEPVDYVISWCQAEVAASSGYKERREWSQTITPKARATLKRRTGSDCSW